MVEPQVARARSMLAVAVRLGAPPEQVEQARADLARAMDSKLISELLAGRHLTPEGLTRLSSLLKVRENGAGDG